MTDGQPRLVNGAKVEARRGGRPRGDPAYSLAGGDPARRSFPLTTHLSDSRRGRGSRLAQAEAHANGGHLLEAQAPIDGVSVRRRVEDGDPVSAA